MSNKIKKLIKSIVLDLSSRQSLMNKKILFRCGLFLFIYNFFFKTEKFFPLFLKYSLYKKILLNLKL